MVEEDVKEGEEKKKQLKEEQVSSGSREGGVLENGKGQKKRRVKKDRPKIKQEVQPSLSSSCPLAQEVTRPLKRNQDG